MYIYLIGCFILFYFGESFLSQAILPRAMLNSPIIVLCNSATACPKPGMKKEEGLKKKLNWKKNQKSVFLNWLETAFRHIITFLFLAFIFSSTSRLCSQVIKKMWIHTLARILQAGFKILQVGFKTCKNLARSMYSLAR